MVAVSWYCIPMEISQVLWDNWQSVPQEHFSLLVLSVHMIGRYDETMPTEAGFLSNNDRK